METATVDAVPASGPADLAVTEVAFRKDLYPRLETDARKVDQYAEDLTVLPPIEVKLPAVGREGVIRQHDLTDGLPRLPRWQDVGLVYLDPPYWKQAEGRYSEDPQDLANMELAEFTETLAGLIRDFGKKLPKGAHIALIIQPTQWNAPDHEFTDHIADMLRTVKHPIAMRISAPYESQQYNAQQVEWAKANRGLLVLTREIVVWRVEK